MKYFKYLTAVALVALFTSFSYADDISGMIFQGNEIDDALIINSTVTLSKPTKSSNVQKTKSQREIDLFIEKAKNDAAKKEEEKLRQEKLRKEEEKLAEEKRKEEERAQREKERELELEKRKEEERAQRELQAQKEQQSQKEQQTQKDQKEQKEQQSQEAPQKVSNQTLLASGITIDSNDVTNFSKTLLGVPYVWGGASLEGFDCSGFVQYVYKKYEMDLSRTTYTQIKQGKSVALADIKENDLVFFDTRASSMLTKAKSNGVAGTLDSIIINESDTGNSKKLYPTEPTHVGMYIGNGKMIHASSSKKQVVVEVLGNDYFKDRIVDIRRYK